MDEQLYRVIVREGAMDMAGFLDMMRYDRCRVVSWERIERHSRGAFRITLMFDREPTLARWSSFGLGLLTDKTP